MDNYSSKIASLVKKYGDCTCHYPFKGSNIYLVEYEQHNKKAKFWHHGSCLYDADIPEEDLKHIWEQLLKNIGEKLKNNIINYKKELANSVKLLKEFKQESNYES